MLLWHCSLFLLWETTSVFAVNPAKIHPQILREIGNVRNVFVSFENTKRALENAEKGSSFSGTIAERAGNVRRYLMNLARGQQTIVLDMLSSRKKYKFESLWVSNRIFIEMPDIELIIEISDNANVSYIQYEVVDWATRQDPRKYERYYAVPSSNFNQNVTKGLELIQAQEAWKVLGGVRKAGEGVTVGVLDSGSFAGHETLIKNFVGINYGFFDASREPVVEAADMAHGTHIT